MKTSSEKNIQLLRRRGNKLHKLSIPFNWEDLQILGYSAGEFNEFLTYVARFYKTNRENISFRILNQT